MDCSSDGITNGRESAAEEDEDDDQDDQDGLEQRGHRVPLKIVAHRGASAEYTENTIEAFERAAELGADGVELDVRLCASGEVAVVHDMDLTRLAGEGLVVAQTSLMDLRAVELKGGGRIPTLAEAFEACGAKLSVNIELKLETARPTGLEEAVDREVRRIGAGRRTIYSSFHPLALWRLWNLSAPGGRALLFAPEQGSLLGRGWHGWGMPIDAVHPEASLVNRRRMQRWHRRGLAVRAWTVDDPERIRQLAVLGVHSVITNEPGKARDAMMGL